MSELTLKQKEAKTIKFTVTDKDSGEVVDLSSAVLKFAVKEKKTDSSYVIEKETADFDLTDAANGVVTVALSETDLDLSSRMYKGELKIKLTAENIDKSGDIDIQIKQAVITD